MAEAGEDQPKRCHCGFWGSPQTMNLCSKCYKDYLQKVKASQAEGTGSSSSPAESQLLQQYFPGLKATLPDIDESSSSERKEETEKETEIEEGEEESGGKDPFLPEDRPVQKSKKRCWVCKAKLELAQRELGGCKCGYVFCFLHRLPEQHDCIYNHKEGGRQEALKTMVPASKKKIGRSFHRMDSVC